MTDTPGLQDIKEKNQVYLQEIKNKVHEVSIVLYCMKMTEHRIRNDDKAAIKELHQAFGPKFWERVIFVFTFANEVKCNGRDKSGPQPDNDDEKARREERFIRQIERRASFLKKFLNEIISIDGIGGFVPAGKCEKSYLSEQSSSFIDPMCLPDRENWLFDLLKLCFDQIKNKHGFKKLRLNNSKHIIIME